MLLRRVHRQSTGPRHLSLGDLVAIEEVAHEVHHVLQLQVNLLEVLVELRLVVVASRPHRPVLAFTDIMLLLLPCAPHLLYELSQLL